jgi:hypothetical protein
VLTAFAAATPVVGLEATGVKMEAIGSTYTVLRIVSGVVSKSVTVLPADEWVLVLFNSDGGVKTDAEEWPDSVAIAAAGVSDMRIESVLLAVMTMGPVGQIDVNVVTITVV